MRKKLLLERTALGKICAFVFCDIGFLGRKRTHPAERTQKRKKALPVVTSNYSLGTFTRRAGQLLFPSQDKREEVSIKK